VRDGVVVKAIAREKDAETGLHAKIFAAHPIELRDGFAGVVRFSKFQVGFGELVEILRTVGMFLDLFGELGEVELRAFLSERVARLSR